jgi:hypothetical protein
MRVTHMSCHMLTCPPPPPAGAPAFNATFFCDSRATTCYFLTASAQDFSSAQATCVALGGQLVVYSGTSAKMEQQMVGDLLGDDVAALTCWSPRFCCIAYFALQHHECQGGAAAVWCRLHACSYHRVAALLGLPGVRDLACCRQGACCTSPILFASAPGHA